LKNDRVRQITVAKSQPGSLTQEQFRKLVYGEHPYGRLYPSEEMIKSFTVGDLKKFYKENVGAQRTTVFVSGKFDAKAMESAVRTAFSSWGKGSAVYTNPPNPKAKKSFMLVERPGAAQSTINLGLPTINPTDPNYVPLSLTNTLLGGYFSSRVTSNIREAKGYTYSPFSQISTRYHDAYYMQNADVTTNVTGPSLKEIFHEIDSLQSYPPSEAELDAVKNYLSGSFVLQNSTRGGIMGQLSFLRLQGLPDSYLTNYVKNVHAVTAKQVQQMAKTYIRPEDMTLVITGDKEKINKQIEEYAKPVVEGK
jgi:predicted Zn-dependent peptidase